MSICFIIIFMYFFSFFLGQLQIQMEKMSKSLKNFISISDFLKNNKSDHLRMMCFVSQYHKGMTLSVLKNCQNKF